MRKKTTSHKTRRMVCCLIKLELLSPLLTSSDRLKTSDPQSHILLGKIVSKKDGGFLHGNDVLPMSKLVQITHFNVDNSLLVWIAVQFQASKINDQHCFATKMLNNTNLCCTKQLDGHLNKQNDLQTNLVFNSTKYPTITVTLLTHSILLESCRKRTSNNFLPQAE